MNVLPLGCDELTENRDMDFTREEASNSKRCRVKTYRCRVRTVTSIR